MVALPGRLPRTRWLTLLTGLGSATAVAAFIASAWLWQQSLIGANGDGRLSDGVRSAQLAAETLLATLLDAETGQRGYLVTGDPDYLQPYNAAVARIPEDIARLERSPLGNPGRTRRIEHVRQLAADKLAELGATIQLWRSGNHDGAIALVRTNKGRTLMDEIRAEMGTIQSGMAERLDRSRSTDQTRAVWGEIIGLVALGCLILAAIFVVQRRAHALVADGFAQLNASTLALEAARQQQQQTTVLLNTILDTTPGLIYAKTRDGRMLLANAATLDVIGKAWADVAGRTDREFLDDPAQGDVVMANDRRIMETGLTEEVEEVVTTIGRPPRIYLSTKTPLVSLNGEVTGLVGVSVEITERKRAEARLRDMVDELNHRVKNTLATVQSIASQTFRGTDPAIREKLETRLLVLASAHDVVTRANWAGACMSDIVSSILGPYAGLDGTRVHAEGPHLKLLPTAAIAIALALHELACNAQTHGALSAVDGRVTIRWMILESSEPQFRMTWSEHGGNLVSPPTRRGFGTRLIERSLAQDLGGNAVILFDPSGVQCVITAPLAGIVAVADIKPFPSIGRM